MTKALERVLYLIIGIFLNSCSRIESSCKARNLEVLISKSRAGCL